MISCLMWIVYFFKQKSAYERRISDWSSDVCSSDLAAHHPGLRDAPGPTRLGRLDAMEIHNVSRTRHPDGGAPRCPRPLSRLPRLVARGRIETGSAWCRERGCQSV